MKIEELGKKETQCIHDAVEEGLSVIRDRLAEGLGREPNRNDMLSATVLIMSWYTFHCHTVTGEPAEAIMDRLEMSARETWARNMTRPKGGNVQ